MEKKGKHRKFGRFLITANILIIIAVAIAGIAIAYMFTAIFTKHGEETTVPKVENMSYTKAVEVLHAKGFNVDIRDSLFRDDVKPGFVIEQFPKAKAVVKPGRKIFLYINAVHPKEVVMDDGADRTSLALKRWTYRQAKARLTELGFTNIRTVTVLGADDRVVKVLANGKPVFQMQKVPITAPIIIEISDGRLGAIRDSLYEVERMGGVGRINFGDLPGAPAVSKPVKSEQVAAPKVEAAPKKEAEPEYFEEPEYFQVEDEGGGD